MDMVWVRVHEFRVSIVAKIKIKGYVAQLAGEIGVSYECICL